MEENLRGSELSVSRSAAGMLELMDEKPTSRNERLSAGQNQSRGAVLRMVQFISYATATTSTSRSPLASLLKVVSKAVSKFSVPSDVPLKFSRCLKAAFS